MDVNVLLGQCRSSLPIRQRDGAQFRVGERSWKLPTGNLQCPESSVFNPVHLLKSRTSRRIKNEMCSASTYSSRINTDIPLYESPGATFDHYLEDKLRVFKAIFPDKRRSEQISEDEWRVHMLPINFLFLTVSPVIDMRGRCKSEGIDYPAGVPHDITKVLDLDIIRWELQGLEEILKPSQFSLSVEGSLYPYRQGSQSRLKGQLEMSITFVVAPVLALVPEEIRQDVAKTVLKALLENMKQKVNGSLLADYNEFKKEKSLKLV